MPFPGPPLTSKNGSMTSGNASTRNTIVPAPHVSSRPVGGWTLHRAALEEDTSSPALALLHLGVEGWKQSLDGALAQLA